MQPLISPVYVADAFLDFDDDFTTDRRAYAICKVKKGAFIPKDDDMTLFDHLVEIEMDQSLFQLPISAKGEDSYDFLNEKTHEDTEVLLVDTKERSKRKRTKEVDIVPEKKEVPQKSGIANSWVDIFAACTILATLSRDTLDISIRFSSASFRSTFYKGSTSPTVFRALFGKATNLATVKQLQDSFLNNSPVAEYINLYRDDGVPLSCHVTLQPLSKLSGNDFTENLAVLTFRSASSVGNVSFCGIGGKPLSCYSSAVRLHAIDCFA
jgi:hypothetical protein